MYSLATLYEPRSLSHRSARDDQKKRPIIIDIQTEGLACGQTSLQSGEARKYRQNIRGNNSTCLLWNVKVRGGYVLLPGNPNLLSIKIKLKKKKN